MYKRQVDLVDTLNRLIGAHDARRVVHGVGERGRDGIGPVSYTHLDVYKRQVVARVGAMLLARVLDGGKYIATLERLRDLGNTVIVVEHDEDTIRAADYVVDMGPGAGEHGGKVCLLYTSRCV